MRKRGVTDFEPRHDRPLARRVLRPAGSLRQLCADLPSADVHARRAVRARLCATRRRADRDVRPRRDEGHRHRGPRRSAAAADGGQLRREVHVRREQPACLHEVPRRRQADRDHPARGVRASPSTAGKCSGRSGLCGSASIRAKASCCTRSPTPTGARCARSCTGPHCRKWSYPTGTSEPTHWNKNVFDMGEVGMGFSANPLTLGCDCLWRDPLLRRQRSTTRAGNAVTIPNAICMHEEDYGISWKHTDFRTDEVEVRRSRRLVISMICTVGNYEYGFFWYFYNDASMEVRSQTVRCAHHRCGAPTARSRAGARWSRPNVYGPNHQHFFNFRLDMSVDGVGKQRLRSGLRSPNPTPR